MRTKKEVLIAHDWELFVGYCFKSPSADNDMLTFVEQEDAERVMKEGPKEYYWSESHELLYYEEEAWEHLIDDILWNNDDLTEEEAERQLLEE